MRITIPTTGSRGDVQPYIALGVGLQGAGHRVRIATHADFEPLARIHGLDFFAIEANGQALQSSATGSRMMQAGDAPFAYLREFARLRQPLVGQLLDGCRQACLDADLVLLSPTALLVSLSVAEKLHLPTCWTSLQPSSPTRCFPNFLFRPAPRWLPFKGLYNLATHWTAGETVWQLMRRSINRARREVLDLPPIPFLGPVAAMVRPQPRLYAYSPHVVPPPPDWGPDHHVTGYWLLEDPGYRPPAELEDFLAAGPPPVYVGFGSNHDRDPAEVTAMVLWALERTGQRGLLHTGWGGLEKVPHDDRVFSVGPVPHDWLFPRVAAVVHHGGSGTLGAALRAGVPSVVVPSMADQPFWGRRNFELGAGPAPVLRKELTAQRLADAIAAAVHDARMRERVARLSALIGAEDGVARAVEVFERCVAAPRRARTPDSRSLGRLVNRSSAAVRRLRTTSAP